MQQKLKIKSDKEMCRVTKRKQKQIKYRTFSGTIEQHYINPNRTHTCLNTPHTFGWYKNKCLPSYK